MYGVYIYIYMLTFGVYWWSMLPYIAYKDPMGKVLTCFDASPFETKPGINHQLGSLPVFKPGTPPFHCRGTLSKVLGRHVVHRRQSSADPFGDKGVVHQRKHLRHHVGWIRLLANLLAWWDLGHWSQLFSQPEVARVSDSDQHSLAPNKVAITGTQ